MVSEKVVVILIVLAILLSVISIVVTLSSVNSNLIPKINYETKTITTNDNDQGQVSLSIINPTVPSP
jgi:hypothetical protein